MRRKSKELIKPEGIVSIKKIYPFFFWRPCIVCGESVKREPVWKIKAHTWIRGSVEVWGGGTPLMRRWGHLGYFGVETVYVCSECAHTEKEAKEKVEELIPTKCMR